MKYIVTFIFVKLLTYPYYVKVQFHKEGCYYNYLNEIINIDFNEQSEEFLQHILEKHLFSNVYNYSSNLWSVLHELGHFFTDSYINLEQFDDHNYYDKKEEWEATEWAINFITEKPKLSKFLSFLLK